MRAAKYSGQFTVTSKQDIIKRCEQSNYKDCRINAYSELIQKGKLKQPPNLIIIDLGLANFDDDIKKLNKVKDGTLRKIDVI